VIEFLQVAKAWARAAKQRYVERLDLPVILDAYQAERRPIAYQVSGLIADFALKTMQHRQVRTRQ
jgi:hypothetical protein